MFGEPVGAAGLEGDRPLARADDSRCSYGRRVAIAVSGRPRRPVSATLQAAPNGSRGARQQQRIGLGRGAQARRGGIRNVSSARRAVWV